MLGSCVAVLVMAVVYEGLKAARQWLKNSAIKHMHSSRDESGSDTPVNGDDIMLMTPQFLTGFVYSALVLAFQCTSLSVISSLSASA